MGRVPVAPDHIMVVEDPEEAVQPDFQPGFLPDLPQGGLLEMNETYEQAALREIREETGLEVKLESFLGIFHNHDMVWSNGDAAHVVSAMFTASIVSGEPRIDEESYELRFFGKEEIPELFAEDHIAALDAYFRGVRLPLLQENPYKANE